jgi:hypothetical protein
MQPIADWLEKLDMSEYAERFEANRIDVSVLPDLTDQDLEKLGILLGDRRKILRAIRELADEAPVSLQSCSATSLARPLSRQSSIPRTCGGSSAPIIAPARLWSSRMAATSPNIWATVFSPILVIRGRMNMMLNAPCEQGLLYRSGPKHRHRDQLAPAGAGRHRNRTRRGW